MVLASDAYPKTAVVGRLEVRLDTLETVVASGTTLLLEAQLSKVQRDFVHEDQCRVYRQLEEINHLVAHGVQKRTACSVSCCQAPYIGTLNRRFVTFSLYPDEFPPKKARDSERKVSARYGTQQA